MPQEMIGKNAGDHRLADGDGADPDTGVVAALGDNLGFGAGAVYCAARLQDRRRWFDGKTRDNRLARRDAAQNSPGAVCKEDRLAIRAAANLVRVFLARERGGGKTIADLDSLDGIDRHERRRKLRIELAINGCAPPRRDTLGNDLDDGANRRAGLAHLFEIGFEEGGSLCVGAEEWIV